MNQESFNYSRLSLCSYIISLRLINATKYYIRRYTDIDRRLFINLKRSGTYTSSKLFEIAVGIYFLPPCALIVTSFIAYIDLVPLDFWAKAFCSEPRIPLPAILGCLCPAYARGSLSSCKNKPSIIWVFEIISKNEDR